MADGPRRPGNGPPSAPAPKDDRPKAKAVAQPAPSAPDHIDATKNVASLPGDVIAFPLTARVETIKALVGGRVVESEEPVLKISVSVHNRSEGKKVAFGGWGIDAQSRATLKDDLGNGYKQLRGGVAESVLAEREGDSIYPGKGVIDLLVFEKPVGKAEWLYLELPRRAVEGSGAGSIVYKIPAARMDGRRILDPPEAKK